MKHRFYDWVPEHSFGHTLRCECGLNFHTPKGGHFRDFKEWENLVEQWNRHVKENGGKQ